VRNASACCFRCQSGSDFLLSAFADDPANLGWTLAVRPDHSCPKVIHNPDALQLCYQLAKLETFSGCRCQGEMYLTSLNENTRFLKMAMHTTASMTKKRAKINSLKSKQVSLEEQYHRFFVAAPAPMWRQEGDHFSLEQPSPVKWVPSETTYGINQWLCATSNA